MSIVSATKLKKAYEPEIIFSDISFSIPNRARIALVGPNGIGKTTLLRILAGEESQSAGEYHYSKGTKFGYLPQETIFNKQHSLWEECMDAISDLLAQEKKLEELENTISENPKDEDILTQYSREQVNFELNGGYTYKTKVEQILTGLGFSKSQYDMSIQQFSGGERTRTRLAYLLLADPDFLILDEPTNHLDIQAVEWLESYLKDWDGAVLIVSHDRFFLDRVVNNIWEMSPVGFEPYRGNYSNYVLQREIRWNERRQFIETEFNKMQKELEFIKRNIAAQRTSMAKGKLKRLSRQIRAIERIGIFGIQGKTWSKISEILGGGDRNPMKAEEAAHRLSALRAPDNRLKKLNLTIRSKSRSGNIILRAKDLEIGFPDNPLFKVDELELRRLECAALIGPNGSGKTTFLRTLLKKLPQLGGELNLGANLKIGYFAQAHESLNPNNTLIQEIDKVGTKMLEHEIRSYLGKFLFSGDDHYKKVSILSGGECGRLALAKLSLTDSNILLLDEPSNHLDIPAQEMLQEVLANYNGTIILVSHDRFLIDALATQVWEINPEEQQLDIFKGTYSEYRGLVEKEVIKEVIKKVVKPIENRIPLEEKKAPQVSKHERKRLEKQMHRLEDRVIDIETKMEKTSELIQANLDNPELIRESGEEYAYLESELASVMDKWGEINTKLEK